MPVQSHVHKYKRAKLGKNKQFVVYRCVLPDCTHYLAEHHIVGQRNVCWVCGKPHIIYRDSNGVLARPHCKSCTKSKKGKDEEVITFDPELFQIPNIRP